MNFRSKERQDARDFRDACTPVREPETEDYGTVAVFKDLYGNLWDLIEFSR